MAHGRPFVEMHMHEDGHVGRGDGLAGAGEEGLWASSLSHGSWIPRQVVR